MNLGGPEALILLAVVILVFGAGWLPKAAKNLGRTKVELDKVQKQVNETKDQVIEATGVKELEATVRKANKVMNTSPQGLLKGAAASAMRPTTTEAATAAAEDSDTEEPASTNE